MKVFLLPSDSHLRNWLIVYIRNSMNTINVLINSHFPINDSYLITSRPSIHCKKWIIHPFLINASCHMRISLFVYFACVFVFSGINSLKLPIPFGQVRTREKTNSYYTLSTNFSKSTYNWRSSKNSIIFFLVS